ncbi:MAG: PLDc N-terminal domain-containing protein [Bacilli bacterium]|nr:PLDc N-terminal domain-containing protein [Bacilli bacterium]
MLYILLILRKLFGFIIALIIVKNSISLNKDIPWIVLVLLFPFLGFLIYFILGSNVIRSSLLENISETFRKSKEYFVQDVRLRNEILKNDNKALIYLSEYSNYPISKRNKVVYYATGEVFFEQVKSELKTAEKFIFIEFFSIEMGVLWEEILDILKEKIKLGVEVRLIYDNMACKRKIPFKYYEVLESYGIMCEPFYKNCSLIGMIKNHHEHRKGIIIDGRIAFTGGMNIEDRYVNLEQPYGYWKDVGISIEGEGVWNFTVMFLGMWNAFRKTDEDYMKYYNNLIGKFDSGGYVVAFGNNPLDQEMVGKNVYINMINQARKYLYIFTPYLIIDMDMDNALALAAKRGVEVKIIIPGIPDKKLVYQVSLLNARKLIKNKVKVYTYSPGFMHGKVFLMDDKIAMVGTMNTDYRSLYLDFEYGVLMEGVNAIEDIKHDVEDTLKKSVEIKLTKINFIQSLWEAILQLLAPLM